MEQLSYKPASNAEIKEHIQGAHLHPRVERTLLQMVESSPGEYSGAQQALAAAGAVNLTSWNTTVDTSGAIAITLADGAYMHQRKRIQMIVDAGAATLTPANLNGGTTITFEDVGDVAELLWDGSAWQAIALYNIVDGATAPALA